MNHAGIASVPCTSMHAPPALISTTLQAITGFFRSTNIDPALVGPLGRTRWYRLCSCIVVDRNKHCPFGTMAAKLGGRRRPLRRADPRANRLAVWITDRSEEPLNDTPSGAPRTGPGFFPWPNPAFFTVYLPPRPPIVRRRGHIVSAWVRL